jgi:hypothetical protein
MAISVKKRNALSLNAVRCGLRDPDPQCRNEWQLWLGDFFLPVANGDTAAIDFWHNKNEQA